MTAVRTTADPTGEALSHQVVYRDADGYCAHPHLAAAGDGTWLLVFNRAPRRRVILHPPLDPAFRNLLIRSHDEGRSWSPAVAVPAASWSGLECAGLTGLADGSVLLNQWQFGWTAPDGVDRSPGAAPALLPEALARHWAASREFEGLHRTEPDAATAALFPLARQGGACWLHRAASGVAPFEPVSELDTRPFSGGYGMRGGLELPDGDILLPLSDVPHYRQVFTLRSRDGGATWDRPQPVALAEGCEFEEPAPVLLPDGSILMLLRDNGSRQLRAVRSGDGGRSWSRPEATGIADYPADLLLLQDGRLAMVAGRRRPPFGIALYLSDDGGTSWSSPFPVRDDLANRDLGYPSLAQRRDGDLVIVYYAQGTDGVTAILASTLKGAYLSNIG